MTKVSVVFYYWILVVAVLLFSKTAGLAENNAAVIKILIVVTILYIGIAMISRSKGKALEEKRAKDGQNSNSDSTVNRRKKKK